MLTAEAMRLAAIEVLSPTAANLGEGVFPTIAGKRVFDSRSVAISDLPAGSKHTPTLALYTAQSESVLRGAGAAGWDTSASAILELVAELSVRVKEGQEEFADASTSDDPDARLLLAALCAQVRYLLTSTEAGYLFRRLVMSIDRIEEIPFAVPEIGVRWQRTTMRFHCTLPDDEFDDAGGLPPQVQRFLTALPDASYAKARLTMLAEKFTGQDRTALETITWSEPGKAADADPDAGFEIPQGD